VVGVGFAALGVIHSTKIHQGNPQRLLHGVDYKGHICGVDSPVQHLDKKWIYNPPSLSGICVDDCPSLGDSRTDVYTGDAYESEYDVSRSVPIVHLTKYRQPMFLITVFTRVSNFNHKQHWTPSETLFVQQG
jgi:hypothetical protein